MTGPSSGYGMPAPFVPDARPPPPAASLLARLHDRLGATDELLEPSELAEGLGATVAEVELALRWLEREGLVRSDLRRWRARVSRLAPRSPAEARPPASPEPLTHALHEVLVGVAEHQGSSRRALAERLGLTVSRIAHALRRLRQLRLVHKGTLGLTELGRARLGERYEPPGAADEGAPDQEPQVPADVADEAVAGASAHAEPDGSPATAATSVSDLPPALAETWAAVRDGATYYRRVQEATGRSRGSVAGSVHQLRLRGLLEPGMPLRATARDGPAEAPPMAPPASAGRSTSTTTPTSGEPPAGDAPQERTRSRHLPARVSPWAHRTATARELEAALPGWRVGSDLVRGWAARSPVHRLDGVVVCAHEPVELVDRVRAHERLWAVALGRAGPGTRAAVGAPADGTGEGACRSGRRAPRTPVAGSSPAPPLVHGTEPCRVCGGFLIRTGSCWTCQGCGETSGCG